MGRVVFALLLALVRALAGGGDGPIVAGGVAGGGPGLESAGGRVSPQSTITIHRAHFVTLKSLKSYLDAAR